MVSLSNHVPSVMPAKAGTPPYAPTHTTFLRFTRNEGLIKAHLPLGDDPE